MAEKKQTCLVLAVCSIFWKQVRDIETLFSELWFAIDIIYVLNFIVQ